MFYGDAGQKLGSPVHVDLKTEETLGNSAGAIFDGSSLSPLAYAYASFICVDQKTDLSEWRSSRRQPK